MGRGQRRAGGAWLMATAAQGCGCRDAPELSSAGSCQSWVLRLDAGAGGGFILGS